MKVMNMLRTGKYEKKLLIQTRSLLTAYNKS